MSGNWVNKMRRKHYDAVNESASGKSKSLSIEAIKKRMIDKGAVFPISARDALRFRNVGPLTLEILRQQGLLLPDFMDGLSPRAVNCLFNMEIHSKEETRKAIDNGALRPGKVRNLGEKTYMEICGWAWE